MSDRSQMIFSLEFFGVCEMASPNRCQISSEFRNFFNPIHQIFVTEINWKHYALATSSVKII